jgi:rhomboid protease GluP
MTGEDAMRQVAPSPVADEEPIPIIGEEMLHQGRVDLEAGMSFIPPVTLLMMAACIAVFARQAIIGGLDNVGRVIATGAMHRAEVLEGQVWRLVSAGFMHAGADHLTGNMLMLFVLGMACEHAFGHSGFLFLYVAACFTGSLLTMISDAPTVGASGAIFGLAGAIIAMMYVHRRRIEMRDHRVGIVLAIWSVYTLVLGQFSPIVSNSCHLGGLMGGLALGAILPPAILTNRAEFARRPGTRVMGAVAVAVFLSTAWCFILVLR